MGSAELDKLLTAESRKLIELIHQNPGSRDAKTAAAVLELRNHEATQRNSILVLRYYRWLVILTFVLAFCAIGQVGAALVEVWKSISADRSIVCLCRFCEDKVSGGTGGEPAVGSAIDRPKGEKKRGEAESR